MANTNLRGCQAFRAYGLLTHPLDTVRGSGTLDYPPHLRPVKKIFFCAAQDVHQLRVSKGDARRNRQSRRNGDMAIANCKSPDPITKLGRLGRMANHRLSPQPTHLPAFVLSARAEAVECESCRRVAALSGNAALM